MLFDDVLFVCVMLVWMDHGIGINVCICWSIAFWGILDDVGAKRGGLQWEFREMDCSRVGASG